MRQELVPRTIDGRKYEISQFGASQSWRILVRLSKMIGEPVANLISDYDPKKKVLDQDLGKVIPTAVAALVRNVEEEESLNTIKELVFCTLCNGAPINNANFDLHFRGGIGHMMKVVKAVLEVQYGDFLGAVVDLQTQQSPTLTQASQT